MRISNAEGVKWVIAAHRYVADDLSYIVLIQMKGIRWVIAAHRYVAANLSYIVLSHKLCMFVVHFLENRRKT